MDTKELIKEAKGWASKLRVYARRSEDLRAPDLLEQLCEALQLEHARHLDVLQDRDSLSTMTPRQSGLSESQIVLALSQHRDARPVVSGWPGPQWGKGWHGYCSCGWSGNPHGKDDAAKAQAQLDTDYHVASVLLSVQP